MINGTVTVTEVPAGHLAELPCPSSDDQHRFMFWQLRDDKSIIGPGNPLDSEKYNYEVLTGKLFIRVRYTLLDHHLLPSPIVIKSQVITD